MAKFVLSTQYEVGREIDAERFYEEGTFVHFHDAGGKTVFAVPTRDVTTIERHTN